LLGGGTYSPDSPLLQGLYHATFPNREDVFPAALAFARELAANTSQTSVAWTKALLWRGADSIEGQHVLESRGLSDLASRGDAAEGVQAFLERRAVRFSDVLSKNMSEFVPWVRRSCGFDVVILTRYILSVDGIRCETTESEAVVLAVVQTHLVSLTIHPCECEWWRRDSCDFLYI
jgi:hypothetical protein